MSRRRVCWSELPSELLTLIAERLESKPDFCHFKLVCKQWHHSTSFVTNLPINLLSPILPHKFSIINSSSRIIVTTSVVVVQSLVDSTSAPLLCTVEELNPGKLHLRWPLSQSAKRLEPKILNFSYYKVKEVGRFHTLRCLEGLKDMFNTLEKFNENKVVLIADPNCKTIPGINDYKAVVWDKNWSLHLIVFKYKYRRLQEITGPNNIKMFDDVINFKGKLFVIDHRGRAYTMNYNSSMLHIVVSDPVGEGSSLDRKKRLVETRNGDLYLVYRCPSHIRKAFKLYKLNEETNKWDEIEGIGADNILMVTSDGCFFVETKDFPGWKGNCIAFRAGHFPAYRSAFGPDEEIFGHRFRYNYLSEYGIAVFDFDTGDCKPLNTYSGYSKLLFPPEDFLSLDARLLKSLPRKERFTILESSLDLNKQYKDQQGISPNLQPKVKDLMVVDIDLVPDITPKAAESVVSLGKFRGVNVSSNLVPVLEKIWETYGNLMQDNVVHSHSLLTWALESLAKMVVVLAHTKSSESWSEHQAKFLSATLKDLKLMNIRVDWLAPLVEKVLARGPKLGCNNSRPFEA